MISIQESFTISGPVSEVWPLLSDPNVVVTCVPGATLVADHGDGRYDGLVGVKFGPTQIAFDHENHRCSIEARGQDQRGASGASATANVAASEENGATTVTVSGAFNVTGPLATFARTGGQHLAREILAEFSRNFSALIAARTAEAAPAAEDDPAPVSQTEARPQLSAFKLIWSLIKALFGKRTAA
jgi:carbon monoxide dehydrogenase subunit G